MWPAFARNGDCRPTRCNAHEVAVLGLHPHADFSLYSLCVRRMSKRLKLGCLQGHSPDAALHTGGGGSDAQSVGICARESRTAAVQVSSPRVERRLREEKLRRPTWAAVFTAVAPAERY